jgi:sulfhydrogenase subunit alpha
MAKIEKIELDYITKIEGHAKLTVRLDKTKKVARVVRLEVFESPRYFEALIKGRSYKEVPYLAGRICGICNVAHHFGAMMAVENALGVKVSDQTKMLRELLVLGGILHSHALHLYLLSLPDYLGYSSALDMTNKHLKLIRRGLKMKETGNDIVNLIGGRSMHPLTSVIGGFTKLPKTDRVKALTKKLNSIKDDAMKTVDLFSSLKSPKLKFETDFYAIGNGRYSFIEGDVQSLSGISFKPENYKKYLKESFVSHSSSKHVTIKGNSFAVGPLARMNINHKHLRGDAKKALKSTKEKFPTDRIFSANLARAVEVVYCIQRAKQILRNLDMKKGGCVKIKTKAGDGVSATEAPRGVLYHHYKFNKDGNVTYVNLIPPTTQNVKNMEDMMREILPDIMHLPKKKITLELEKLIRVYDPCFSCSAHFLELNFIK